MNPHGILDGLVVAVQLLIHVWLFLTPCPAACQASLSFTISPSLSLQLQHQSFQWIFRQGWFPLVLTVLISLVSRGLSRVFSAPQFERINSLALSAFFMVQLSHPYMTAGKTIALTRQTFVSKVMSLLLNTLSRFVTAFLPRSKRLLISWLHSPSTVILEPKKIKYLTLSTFPSSICHEWDQMPWS